MINETDTMETVSDFAHCSRTDVHQATKLIHDLPQEVLSQIFACLDVDPPSISKSNQIPSIELLYIANPPLKVCSSVNRLWRSIAFPLLFKCLRVPLNDLYPVRVDEHWRETSDELYGSHRNLLCMHAIDWMGSKGVIPGIEFWFTAQAHMFYDFIHREKLGRLARSLILFNRSGWLSSSNEDVRTLEVHAFWMQLFRRLSLESVIILAPPRTLGYLITKCKVDHSDAWAFGILYQRLELHRTLSTTRTWMTESSRLTSLNGNYATVEGRLMSLPSDELRKPEDLRVSALADQRTKRTIAAWSGNVVSADDQVEMGHRRGMGFLVPSLQIEGALELQPWTHLRDVLQANIWTTFNYHSGSCLNAYGTYHYFDKMPPCILTHNPVLANISSQILTSFSYKTVFAHSIHFRSVVSMILKLQALESLSLQLAPAADSGVLDDLQFIGHGSVRLRDCWMEAEKSYSEVIRIVLGRGTSTVMPALRKFTSYDCVREVLKDELELLFALQAPGWTKSGDIEWLGVGLNPTTEVTNGGALP